MAQGSGWPWSGPWGWTESWETIRPQQRPEWLREQALKNLTPEQQKRLEDLEAIKKEVEGLQASEKIVWARLDVIGKRLLEIKKHPTEAANPEDKEYGELVKMFERLEAEYKAIAEDNSKTSHILSFYLQEFSGEVDEKIWDIRNEGTEHTHKSPEIYDVEWENNDFNVYEKSKSDFFLELSQLWDTYSKESAWELIKKYWYNNISDWLENSETESYKKQKIFKLFATIDTRDFENAESLQSIWLEDFLSQIPHEQRLQYFSQTSKDYTPKEGDSIDITFRFEWKLNGALESGMKLWNIIPESVSKLQVGDTIYERKWLLGEFYSTSQEWQTSTRLIVRDGENIKIHSLLSSEEVSKEHERIEWELGKLEWEAYNIQKKTLLEWLSKLPEWQLKTIQDTLPDTWAKNYSGALESRISDVSTTPSGHISWLSKIEGWGIIGAIWNMIVEMLQDPESPVSQAGSVDAYLDSIWNPWLTAEQLKQYGDTWSQLAAWIKSIGYRKFVDKPWNCGANVWEALEAFGFKWLPQTGRDGHLWAKFCAERPSQFKKFNGPVDEAPAWAIISYKANTWGSEARQKYGHVEIAMWNNTGYYFGQRNEQPWGSNPNPQPWEYEIYVPISKVPQKSLNITKKD